MSKKSSSDMPPNVAEGEAISEQEYDDMEILERLETLREDMEELGITTMTELIARIEQMHKRLDSK
ncbi:MAG TPA: hypothetical protein VKP04_09630 [Ktedonobacteraceae bacterium]|nr:hypothetical protein [Ktedonobacteraceae bacterium]